MKYMDHLTALFLSQSYQDAWDDYSRSISMNTFPRWDYVILTASDENQADGYRRQIAARVQYLPADTHFAVLPDEGNVRVGSGGATLSVLKYIYEQELKKDAGHRKNDHIFDGLRVMVIHSGGDSKRVPMYSAVGKLFSPVPHRLPDGRSSTLFDECMIMMASMPSRIREGMLVLSGDVLLLFNPLQVDFSGWGAAAVSFKEHVDIGRHHGVFLSAKNGNVKKFLHKQSESALRRAGAVNENDCVDIDTGAIIFSTDMMQALYSLIDTPEKYTRYVNDRVRLSLYGDFLYPLAENSTLEQYYREKPEGAFSPELEMARTAVWDALRPYRMKLLRLAPAKFIHFGTTREVLQLMSDGVDHYLELGWDHKVNSSMDGDIAGYNSVLADRVTIGSNCYLESSYVHGNTQVGNGVVLSCLDLHDEVIPDDVVLHGLKQKNGKFVCRIYGVGDNPKESCLFGIELNTICRNADISADELWDGDEHTLWMARLYPECDDMDAAIRAAVNLYAWIHGAGDIQTWCGAERMSLCAGFRAADAVAIIAWNRRMQELVQMNDIANAIVDGRPAASLGRLGTLTKIQKQWIFDRLRRTESADKIRLYYYLGSVLDGQEGSQYMAKSFQTVSDQILQASIRFLQYNETCKISKKKHTVRLPLRVNWGGGWSDTPPICCDLGGTVLNAAIKLNGELPVEVTLIRIPEKKIVFDSRDMDVHGEFETIEPLQETGNPYDAFALQKACLLVCGIIPYGGGNLSEILERLGGGFEMHSEVTNVPKGSGLGTSSILAAACVRAVFEFVHIRYTDQELYTRVLMIEQIMSTGGGWQDQIGGVTAGVKFISSRPGWLQQPQVQQVELQPDTLSELNERFCLIYTGQRRLARNLLRDVVGRYIGNEPDSLFALNEIQRVAALMKFELERGDIDAFAQLLERHWTLSQKVDAGSSNTLIAQIFRTIDDLIDARMVCGAGGGGFLQVILKKGVSKSTVHDRLKEVFQDTPVDIWECEII